MSGSGDTLSFFRAADGTGISLCSGSRTGGVLLKFRVFILMSGSGDALLLFRAADGTGISLRSGSCTGGILLDCSACRILMTSEGTIFLSAENAYRLVLTGSGTACVLAGGGCGCRITQ